MTGSTPYLFNPARAGTVELEQTFVGRTPVLDKLVQDLLNDAMTTTSRHWLLVGPRGTGKTHLTELLGRRLCEIHHWEVVRLPEEQYQVASLADLLEQIVLGLGAPGTPSPFANEADPRVVEERALSFLRTRSTRPNAHPLLVILENLNRVLERKLRSSREQTRFRQILLKDAPFHVVATSPTYFDAIAKESAPFYDFFQTLSLEELTREDVASLIEKRARYDREEPLLARLDQVRARLDALYHHSGGNPRLVLALYSILKEGVSDEVYVQLMKLLDEVTPYYQARLEDITDQMALVLTQLALAEGPKTPADIAKKCRMPTSQTTANVAKLVRDRFVKAGGRPDKRRRYYEVTDRLFRLWIQMREDRTARRRLPFLTEFFQQWYAGDREEVRIAADRVAGALFRDLSEGVSSRCGEHLATLEYLREAIPGRNSDPSFIALRDAVFDNNKARLPVIIAQLSNLEHNTEDPTRKAILQSLIAWSFFRLEKYTEALPLWRSAFYSEHMPRQVAAPFIVGYFLTTTREVSGLEKAYTEGLQALQKYPDCTRINYWLASAAVELHDFVGMWSHVDAFDQHGRCPSCLARLLLRLSVDLLHEGEFGWARRCIDRLTVVAAERGSKELMDEAAAIALVWQAKAGHKVDGKALIQLAQRWNGLSLIPQWLLDEVVCFFSHGPRSPKPGIPFLEEVIRRDGPSGSAWAAEHWIAMAIKFEGREGGSGWQDFVGIGRDIPAKLIEQEFIRKVPTIAKGGRMAAQSILATFGALREAGLLPRDLEPYSTALRVRSATGQAEAQLNALHPEVREAVSLLLHLNQKGKSGNAEVAARSDKPGAKDDAND